MGRRLASLDLYHLIQQRPGAADKVRGHRDARRLQAQAAPALPVGADPQIAHEPVRHRVLQPRSTVDEHVWRQGNKGPNSRATKSGLFHLVGSR